MLNKLLNVDEALAYLRERGVKITKKTLYSKLSRNNKPHALKIGRELRFTTDDLDDYIVSITKER
jgi:predicted DNA-binding transcriptional regulator AlpA